jgi:hypothetical protein
MKLCTTACHLENVLLLTVTLKTYGLLVSPTNTVTLKTSSASSKCAPMEILTAEVDSAQMVNVFHATLEHNAPMAMPANVTLLAWKLLAHLTSNAQILLMLATLPTDNVNPKHVLLVPIAEQMPVTPPPTSVQSALTPFLAVKAITARTLLALHLAQPVPKTLNARLSLTIVILLLELAEFNLDAQTHLAADLAFATPRLLTVPCVPEKDQIVRKETALIRSLETKMSPTSATKPLESVRS